MVVPSEHGELGRAQARWREVLVVDLGDVPGGLAQSQAVAGDDRLGFGHGGSLTTVEKSAYAPLCKGAYARIRVDTRRSWPAPTRGMPAAEGALS